MILKGLDEDWSKVNPTQAWLDGFRFIFGYVSQDGTGKNFSPGDVASIFAAGFAIGLVYEYNPQSALGGYLQGVTDANIAIAHAQSLGVPRGVALYAAVDWNVLPGQMSTCLAYATGFLDTCAAAGFRSGIYGGYPLCYYLTQHNYGGFLWQTYAWSNGAWLAAAAVRQTLNGISEAGATVDLDESERIDFGQWERELAMTQMLVRPNDDPQVWLCDGMFRRRIADSDLVHEYNGQVHQDALLGPLGNGGQIFTTGPAAGMDVWGIDIETLTIAKVSGSFTVSGSGTVS